MTRSKHITAICILITLAMLATTVLFMSGESLGLTAAHASPQYAEKLFSTDTVHEIDIKVDEEDWQAMLDSAQSEEYIMCDVVIDGVSMNNVAIRPKGNSSLSTIASSDSDRYSFKIEFDHYNSSQTFYGLDKFALNNIAQDNTYLKDYVSYQMMNSFDADAPLSSFIYIKVNGQDWGLYIAVEGIEESFAKRSYGSDYGEIYKPDSMDIGGGRDKETDGGMNRPDMGQFPGNIGDGEIPDFPQNGQFPQDGQKPQSGQFPQGGQMPQAGGQQRPDFPQDGQIPDNGQTAPDIKNGNTQTPPGFPGQQMGDGTTADGQNVPGGFGNRGGMGSNSQDVALKYIDDNTDSYPNIFDNAVFNPTDADKKRLIEVIKTMNEGDMELSVNVDEVLRYFVVHNFVLNFDSYTGSMLHNYYLYEDDGILSMIAWDYNLAFGAFSMGNNSSGQSVDNATALVNYPIDTPTSGTALDNIPLLGNLLNNVEYLKQYHELFSQFISGYFDSGEFERMYDNAVSLISPYVEKDPTAFCTYDEFTQAQQTLKQFCLLRANSIKGQLDGSIASTTEEQSSTQNTGFIDASTIDISVMGSNMSSFGRGRDIKNGQQTGDNTLNNPSTNTPANNTAGNPDSFPSTQTDVVLQDTAQSGNADMKSSATTGDGGQSWQSGQTRPQQGGEQGTPLDGKQSDQSGILADGSQTENNRMQIPQNGLQQNMQYSIPENIGSPLQSTTGQVSTQTLLILLVSGVFTTAGLLFVKLYKN